MSALSVFLHLLLTAGGLAQAGVSLPFVRAENFQIPTKLSAKVRPRLSQTACCAVAHFTIFILSQISNNVGLFVNSYFPFIIEEFTKVV